LSQLSSEATVALCSFTSNVQCVRLAAGRRFVLLVVTVVVLYKNVQNFWATLYYKHRSHSTLSVMVKH